MLFGFGKKKPKTIYQTIQILEDLKNQKKETVSLIFAGEDRMRKTLAEKARKIILSQMKFVAILKKQLDGRIRLNRNSREAIERIMASDFMRTSDDARGFIQEFLSALLEGSAADYLRTSYSQVICPLTLAEEEKEKEIKKGEDRAITQEEYVENNIIPHMAMNLNKQLELAGKIAEKPWEQFRFQLNDLIIEEEKLKAIILTDERIADGIIQTLENEMKGLKRAKVVKTNKIIAITRMASRSLTSAVLITFIIMIAGPDGLTRREAENLYNEVARMTLKQKIQKINEVGLPKEVEQEVVAKIAEKENELAAGGRKAVDLKVFNLFVDISVDVYTKTIMSDFKVELEKYNNERLARNQKAINVDMNEFEPEIRSAVLRFKPIILAKMIELREHEGWDEWFARTGFGFTAVNQAEQDIRRIIENTAEQGLVEAKRYIGRILSGLPVIDQTKSISKNLSESLGLIIGIFAFIAILGAFGKLRGKSNIFWKLMDWFVFKPIIYPFTENGFRRDLASITQMYILELKNQ